MKPLSKFALLAAISASLPAYAQTPDMRPTITIPSAAVSSAPDLAYGAYQRGYYVTAFKEAMTRISIISRIALSVSRKLGYARTVPPSVVALSITPCVIPLVHIAAT